MASNDPTDTGGLFIGRRPGTRPIRFPVAKPSERAARRNADKGLAAGLLLIETLLCLSVWGPQPLGWLWVAGHVQGETGSVTLAIVTGFVGMLVTLFVTLAIARRVDHAWKLVRRAAGYRQERGALERIFVVALLIVATSFWIWFFLIQGPGSSVFPQQAPK